MPQYSRVVAEAALAVLATAFAIFVRDNFEVVPGRWEASAPFLVTTGVLCLIVFPAVGIQRGIWRFNTSAELPRLVAAAVGVTMAALLAMFFYDRLTSVARATPLLQFFFILATLCGVRVIARHHHLSRQSRASVARPLQLAAQPNAQNVIVVGLNRLAETYLLAVTEMAPTRVKVVGLLGRNDQHVGRSIGAYPVIGRPQDIDTVLRDLEVHGVAIDKIVVATLAEDLSADALAALRRLEMSSDINVQYLADGLGLSPPKRSDRERGMADSPVAFQFSQDELTGIARRPYWVCKRVLDVILALVALVVLWPVMVVITIGVAIGIGRPIFFWQQRPGLGGTSFRVYKFRTMALT